jgi:hypothetical protein
MTRDTVKAGAFTGGGIYVALDVRGARRARVRGAGRAAGAAA